MIQYARLSLILMSLSSLAGDVLMAETFVVASHTSLNREKADFVCSGSDDQVQIQQAVDALPPSGGMITLLEGAYVFGDQLEISRNNVTIRGLGRSTDLKHAPTEWVKLTRDATEGTRTIEVADPSQFRAGQLIGVSDESVNPQVAAGSVYDYYNNYYVKSYFHTIVEVSGSVLTLDRDLSGSVTVQRNARAAPGWVMIKAYGKTGLVLSDFSIDGNWENVARIYAGYNTYVAPPDYPFEPSPPPPSIIHRVHHGEEPTSAVYMDNAHNSRFENLYIHDVPMTGIFLFASDHVIARGNTIRNFGLKGYVNCFGSHTRVIGNEIENSLYEDGINIYDVPASFSVVSNNIVKNCRRGCILINQSRRAVVSGNNLYQANGQGSGISVVTREAAVTGNYIEGAGYGMHIRTLAEFWKDDNADYPITVTGNTLKNCAVGFNVVEAHQVTISGNAISQTRGPVAIRSSGNSSSNGIIIANNQFLGSTIELSAAIALGGKHAIISGNVIRNFNTGIRLEETSGSGIVHGNQFIDVNQKVIDQGISNSIDELAAQ